MTVTPTRSACLRTTHGLAISLHVDRWWSEPGVEEQQLLQLALPATLDLGCGPARHTLALARAGVPALGVDNAISAIRAARSRGAQVLHRSVFDRLPGEGTWGAALLLDGNVGIGGDPDALLSRVRGLVRPGGRALIEVEPPGVNTERLHVRAEHADVVTGWFPWARVGADHVRTLAERSGFRLVDLWSESGRWFGRLDAT
jgi:SAM-dependent methyltransferase